MIHRAVRKFAHILPVAAISVLGIASSHAQALFQPLTAASTTSSTLPAGNTPLGVAVADFNHDGYPDMVVANAHDASLGTSGTISVYMASGSGTFAAPVKYPTCGGPTAVLAEDLDLTGLPDIVITCNTSTSNVIEVFLNQGNGTFNPVVDGVTNIVLGTGMGPVALVSGDFNNDGHPDLAVADRGDGTITLFLSNPANDFTYYTVKTLSGYGTPQGIAAGRFTTSGNLDLAVTDSSTNTVHILTGDGAGSFTTGASPATGTHPTGVVASDFNRDGKQDLAVVNSTSGTVSLLYGQGNGSFTSGGTLPVGNSTSTGAYSIIAMSVSGKGALNGNHSPDGAGALNGSGTPDGNRAISGNNTNQGSGTLDLVVANPLLNTVAVLINNGDGTFQPAQDYSVPNGPAYLAAGDFNRNGKPDLAVTQNTGSAVSVLINNTLPTPVPGGRNLVAPTLIQNGNGNMADSVAVGDFNHDGYPDVAVSYLEDNAVRVLKNPGNSSSAPTAAVYSVGKNPYWVAAGDLTNNGYSDLVTANTGDNTVSVLKNNADGSGTFAASVSYPVGRLPYQVAIGDLNGDGIADLAVTNYGDNTVSILYGQTGGTFSSGQTLTTCINPYGVVIGDFRHTGQNDVAVTCFASAQLEVFLNNGMQPFHPAPAQTTFQTGAIYTTAVKPTSLVIGDFNRDGNLDVVTGNSVANSVSFFAGNGDGTFKAPVDSFALNFPDSIAAGDVNGDGIPDIVAVAPNFNKVTVLLGAGDGTFVPRLDFPAGPQPWAVALADFNLDGKLDVITANTFNRVNLTIPAYQQQYMKEFPPVSGGNPSVYLLLNGSTATVSVSASPNGSVAQGTPVTVTATVAAALGGTTPTGTVIFEDTNGTRSGSIALSGGTASYTFTGLSSGTHQFTALYSGNASYQPRTSAGPDSTVIVAGTPVTLTVSPNPLTPSTVLSYSITVGTASAGAPNPVGTVTVYVVTSSGQLLSAAGPFAIGTAGTGGVSTLSKTIGPGIPVGRYTVYATFQPAAGSSYGAGSSPTSVIVSQ